jgi:hypothetical protein
LGLDGRELPGAPDRGSVWEVLDPVEWYAVRWAGERARVLNLVRQGDHDAFRAYIDELYSRYSDDYLAA